MPSTGSSRLLLTGVSALLGNAHTPIVSTSTAPPRELHATESLLQDPTSVLVPAIPSVCRALSHSEPQPAASDAGRAEPESAAPSLHTSPDPLDTTTARVTDESGFPRTCPPISPRETSRLECGIKKSTVSWSSLERKFNEQSVEIAELRAENTLKSEQIEWLKDAYDELRGELEGIKIRMRPENDLQRAIEDWGSDISVGSSSDADSAVEVGLQVTFGKAT